jgi:hypothetical protein
VKEYRRFRDSLEGELDMEGREDIYEDDNTKCCCRGGEDAGSLESTKNESEDKTISATRSVICMSLHRRPLQL